MLMLMTRPYLKSLLLLACAALFPRAVQAQDLMDEIVVSLPPHTVRIEFARLGKLRQLPDYSNLRERFLGPRLSALERSLGQLGLGEADIDQIVLAWQPIGKVSDAVDTADADADGGIVPNRWPAFLDGLAAGHFDAKVIAEHARDRHVSTMSFNGRSAYCLQAGASTCVLFLNESLAVFGARKSLSEILDARGGAGANLVSSQRLLGLLQDVPAEASIWGVAIGPAAAQWFRAWLPGQGDLQLDWPRMLASVEAFQYSVVAGENLRVDIHLECKTGEAAATLAQVFQGVRLIQQLIWQAENPNRMNPVQTWEVKTESERVSLRMTTTRQALQDYNSSPPRPDKQ